VQTTIEQRSGATWIAIRGRLDTGTAPALHEQLDAVVVDGCGMLVFDVSELEYVSSAGLSCFFAAAQRIEPSGGSLVFVSPCEFVARVFEIAGIAKRYRVCADASEV